MEFLTNQQAINEAFTYVEERTRIPKSVQLYFVIILTGLWLSFGYGAQLLCNLIGFIYPAYESIRAIESPPKDDDTQWLMYWAVFGLFACVDYVTVNFLGGLQFYYLLKCIFLVWCFLPIRNNGSHVLYNTIIRGIFIQYHEHIDEALRSTGRNIVALFKTLAEKVPVEAAKLAETGKVAMSRAKDKSREVMEKYSGSRGGEEGAE